MTHRMTTITIPKIYNTDTHNDTQQRFITCTFKIVYTNHMRVYKISETHTIERFIQKMTQYIRNDLYLELQETPCFELVNADHYSIHGVASEQGPALISSSQHTLDTLVNRHENNDDAFLAFYIRPFERQNVVNTTNNT